MPRHYAARHRSARRIVPGRRHEPRRGSSAPSLLRPLSVSAVGVGLTLVLVQAATNVADMTRANAVAPATAPTEALGPWGLSLVATSPATIAAIPQGSGTATSATATTVTSTTPPPTTTTVAPKPSIDAMKTWGMPVAGVQLSSSYGQRWGAAHRGIDLAGPLGTPLKAMSGGVVKFAGQQSGYGNLVQITYWDGTVSYYGHMNSVAVRTGQSVVPGQVVGELGNTGQSTGPHCHLEIHPGGGADVDPLPWLTQRGLAIG